MPGRASSSRDVAWAKVGKNLFSVFWESSWDQTMPSLRRLTIAPSFRRFCLSSLLVGDGGARRGSAVLYRMLYKSVAQTDLDADEIEAILEQSRRRNAADGITGVLLYHNRHIMQVLEGERDKIDACYARIRRDPRHVNVKTLSYSLAGKKQFSDWFMGYDKPDEISGTSEALVTLEQLRARLDSESDQDFGHRRMAVMSRLKSYLLTIANEAPSTT